jgi:putative Holliday junction resolvase
VRLGVDVGSVRVGVAASDPAAVLATPVTVLTRDRKTGADLDALGRLVIEREAVEVVVGLPRSMSGAEGAAAQAAREFAVALAARIAPVGVRLVDERLSTVEATRAMQRSGVRARAGRASVDAAAAVVILQHALDSERSADRPAGELVQ